MALLQRHKSTSFAAAFFGTPSACVVVVVLAVLAGCGNAQRASNSNCKKPDGLFPHEQYCDYYYDCQDGEAVLQACPNGLAFAGKKKGLLDNCDYPHKVGCPDEDNRVMGQSPESTENCHWKYGIFAHATSCTRYWQCWNGTATNQQCPFSLLYNDAAHACDWPDNVPDCQKHPICKDTANGPIPIEKSCARYWLCVGGYPRLQRCSAGLAFNADTLKCELAHTVPGCEPPPSDGDDQAADDDDDDSSGSSGNSGGSAGRPSRGGARPQQVSAGGRAQGVASVGGRVAIRPASVQQQQFVPAAAPVRPQTHPQQFRPVAQLPAAVAPQAPPPPPPPQPQQQYRPAVVAPAAPTETPEYEYEDDTEPPTTQRPRRRPVVGK